MGSVGRQFWGKGSLVWGCKDDRMSESNEHREPGVWKVCLLSLLFDKVSMRPVTKSWRNVRVCHQSRGSQARWASLRSQGGTGSRRRVAVQLMT